MACRHNQDFKTIQTKYLQIFRKVYWLDAGGSGVYRKIGSMNLDGSEPEVLISNNLQGATRIHADVSAQALYWTDKYGQKVRKSTSRCTNSLS